MLILCLVFFPRNANVREIVLQNKKMRMGGYPVGWSRSGLWGLFFVVCKKKKPHYGVLTRSVRSPAWWRSIPFRFVSLTAKSGQLPAWQKMGHTVFRIQSWLIPHQQRLYQGSAKQSSWLNLVHFQCREMANWSRLSTLIHLCYYNIFECSHLVMGFRYIHFISSFNLWEEPTL